MRQIRNHLGQPIGEEVPQWKPRPRPERVYLEGNYARLEPLQASKHADALYRANSLDAQQALWTYLPYGPFPNQESYFGWVQEMSERQDPLFFAVVDREISRAVGVAAYLRIEPEHGCLEVGHICYSPLLQDRPAGTEAMYLLMRYVFEELAYRRYEWKCDALNEPSRRAAQRLGFSFEGVFRQACVVKGRNRDTAWYAMIDKDWPALKTAYERWLSPDNFDTNGVQKERLSLLTAPLLRRDIQELSEELSCSRLSAAKHRAARNRTK
ncbi:acetyltransferase, ribosomal protein N-acetylase [Chthonomonas calidirosea]|uniref:GNAT family N-acetyltransferase n=1 Tax=Chthonomonas calidirosea TaxID=454171 RepID=UPI0006DD4BAE|nr:GNAT family protein [Chthonomonas calidirosea]CEK15840.1 acetyltransferase, ribosomal protein N-acetylase [Chthonomonas calidirosea]